MNNALRRQKYQAAEPVIQDLYADPAVGSAQQEIFVTLGLNEQIYREYVHIFGDIVLGLAKPSELRVLIAGRLLLPEPQANQLANAIEQKLFPLLPAKMLSAQEPASAKPNDAPDSAAMRGDLSVSAPIVGYANVPTQTQSTQAARTLSQPAPTYQTPPPAPPSAPTPPAVPQYQKPLTNAPRYGENTQ